MTLTSNDLASGKGHRDENFPVASFIIKPRHRAAVMAFYRFARKADDIADHPTLPAAVKRQHLETMRAALNGENDADDEAVALRGVQQTRGLSCEHGLDLLEAFRRDVDTLRYRHWGALLDYCRYSAMPVGRFVLDVHEENRGLWPASDALCAALQVINHLQDCGKDYRELGRVYLPSDLLEAHGCSVEDLGRDQATDGLKAVIRTLALQTVALLEQSRPFAHGVRDTRLAYEVAAIQRLAEDLTQKLLAKDPLSERVRHRRLEMVRLLALAAKDRLIGRPSASPVLAR